MYHAHALIPFPHPNPARENMDTSEAREERREGFEDSEVMIYEAMGTRKNTKCWEAATPGSMISFLLPPSRTIYVSW
jgi:hypothetical protein